MANEVEVHPVYRAIHKPLTVWGAERRLFFLALIIGGATFNFSNQRKAARDSRSECRLQNLHGILPGRTTGLRIERVLRPRARMRRITSASIWQGSESWLQFVLCSE